MKPIYAAGYGGHPARSLILAARQLDALVLDIRHTPHSKNPGYDQKELRASLDSRYLHLPDLGNVNHAGNGAIELKNGLRGIGTVLRVAQARSVILLCGCGSPVGCHRTFIATLLEARGAVSRELEWPDVPKLDLAPLPDAALSVLQPWAWLICNPRLLAAENVAPKDVENRTWRREFKGPLLIHTGKGFDLDAHFDLCQNERIRRIMPKMADFDRGGIVGTATVTGCVSQSDSEWFCGPHAFTLRDARPLPFLALRGAQGFFSVQAQLAAMKAPKREKQNAV